MPCKTWRWLPVCFYIIATPPTLFDGTRTLSVHFYQLAREGISAEKAHATASVCPQSCPCPGLIAGIVLAIALSFTIRETGSAQGKRSEVELPQFHRA